MSDEPEARMWDEERGSCYESRGRGAYYESAFASSEQLDRAPLLADESYTEVAVSGTGSGAHCHWRAAAEPPSAVRQLTVALVLCGVFMVAVSGTGSGAHCHWRAAAEPPSSVRQLTVALVLCGVFMICELIGGYLAGSLSVMCDAAHMLSDCGGFALALLAFHCAKRRPDLAMSMGYKRADRRGVCVSECDAAHMLSHCGGFALALLAFHCAKRRPDLAMSMGYKRAEVLGAMVSVLLIWVLTGIFVYVACVRLRSGDYSIESAPCWLL
ncbi:unnamed protein product [Plutella xylostella]|uniref:(diamondback moth) hypothetical protein n=1 Tax=Plutella xylostella TaxID=51655 RepID=A0A8S4GB44_PLUXY|nr:unnamed protein product [Plutella xylostella]